MCIFLYNAYVAWFLKLFQIYCKIVGIFLLPFNCEKDRQMIAVVLQSAWKWIVYRPNTFHSNKKLPPLSCEAITKKNHISLLECSYSCLKKNKTFFKSTEWAQTCPLASQVMANQQALIQTCEISTVRHNCRNSVWGETSTLWISYLWLGRDFGVLKLFVQRVSLPSED